MKILVLTKNNPVQIIDITNRIFISIFEGTMKNGLCISPQTIALTVEEAKGIPYQVAYYPAVKIFEDNKEYLATAAPHLIVVGTVPKQDRNWFDAVVSIDDAESIKDYTKFDEDFNTTHYEYLTLNDAEIQFDNFKTLEYFLRKIIKIGIGKNNEL